MSKEDVGGWTRGAQTANKRTKQYKGGSQRESLGVGIPSITDWGWGGGGIRRRKRNSRRIECVHRGSASQPLQCRTYCEKKTTTTGLLPKNKKKTMNENAHTYSFNFSSAALVWASYSFKVAGMVGMLGFVGKLKIYTQERKQQEVELRIFFFVFEILPRFCPNTNGKSMFLHSQIQKIFPWLWCFRFSENQNENLKNKKTENFPPQIFLIKSQSLINLCSGPQLFSSGLCPSHLPAGSLAAGITRGSNLS